MFSVKTLVTRYFFQFLNSLHFHTFVINFLQVVLQSYKTYGRNQEIFEKYGKKDTTNKIKKSVNLMLPPIHVIDVDNNIHKPQNKIKGQACA